MKLLALIIGLVAVLSPVLPVKAEVETTNILTAVRNEPDVNLDPNSGIPRSNPDAQLWQSVNEVRKALAKAEEANLASAPDFEQWLGDNQNNSVKEAFQTKYGKPLKISNHYPALQKYLQGLVDKILVVEGPDLKVKVELVDELDPSLTEAFANRKIEVSTGMLQKLQSEAELVGILAHEVSHVVLRHNTMMSGAYDETKRLQVVMYKAGLRQGELQKLTGSLNLAYLAEWRSREQEADAKAASVLKALGYSPLALAKALSRLIEPLAQPEQEAWKSDHPSIATRIATIESSYHGSNEGYEGTENYFKAIRNLVAKK